MRVIYFDSHTPRSDGRAGKPTGITPTKQYEVVEIEHDKYTLLNDDNKLARYSKTRFIVVNPTAPKSLRFAFNQLTSPMRMRIKKLEQDNKELKQENNVLTSPINLLR